MSGLFTIGAGAVAVAILANHKQYNDAAAPYLKLMQDAAAKYNVNRSILGAVIWRESKFNPDAVGSKGEIGMGQFLPIAAEDIGISFESLKNNPAGQIDAAAKKLNLDRSRAAGDTFTAVRAYNVGIGKALAESAAGLSYAVEVYQTAFIDHVYGILNGYN